MTDLENSYLELLCCLMTQKFEDSETERFKTKKKIQKKYFFHWKKEICGSHCHEMSLDWDFLALKRTEQEKLGV